MQHESTQPSPGTLAPSPSDAADAPSVCHPEERGSPDNFYWFNLSRITARDCLASGWLGIIVLLAKSSYKRPYHIISQIALVHDLSQHLTDRTEPDPETARHFSDDLVELRHRGFVFATAHEAWNPVLQCTSFITCLTHPTLPIIVRLRHTHKAQPGGGRMNTIDLITGFQDGQIIRTCIEGSELAGEAPGFMVKRLKHASFTELFNAHETTLAAHAQPARPLPTIDDLSAFHHGLHARIRDFFVGRGVWVRATPEEAEAGIAAASHRATVFAQHPSTAPIHLAVEELINKPAGGAGKRTLLIVSALAFIALGMAAWSPYTVLALVPVLLFHEAGHYIAMKAFGYRDLKMFFIPGFGAAVAGRHFNLAAWKRAICYLSGPMPGVLLGAAAIVAALRFDMPLLYGPGILLTLINGVNLLPILPLDGGQILDLVLFRRAPIVAVAARALAGLSLIIAWKALGSVLLLVIGVLVLLSIPATLRLARIVKTLRAQGLSGESGGGDSIPPQTVEQIAGAIKANNPSPQLPAVMAQNVLQIFEWFNARPPGVVVSLALVAVQVVGLAAGTLPLLLVLPQTRVAARAIIKGEDSFGRGRLEPLTQFETASPAFVGSPIETYANAVADFPSDLAAATAYKANVASLKPGETATLIGRTMLVHFNAADPDAGTQWLARLSGADVNAFVTSSEWDAGWEFTASFADVGKAQAAHSLLSEYELLPLGLGLRAPWSPAGKISAAMSSARATCITATEETGSVFRQPEVRAAYDRYMKLEAQADADKAAVEAARDEAFAINLAAKADRLRSERTRHPEWDAATIDLLIALSKPQDDAAINAQLATLLGSSEGSDASTRDYSNAIALESHLNHRTIECSDVTFGHPAAGPGALFTWLKAQGATKIRYKFVVQR